MLIKRVSSLTYLISLLIISFLIFVVATDGASLKYPIKSLYQLGDSIADTGNSARIGGILLPNSRPPFGKTFPGYPTGRWSDARLIIDYIAMAFGLPLLNPSLGKNRTFNNGVNFAVGGSTALNNLFFTLRGIVTFPVASLGAQLRMFKGYLKSNICSTPTECANKLGNSIVFVGEFGYNDIYYPISQGRPIEEVESFIPLVTQTILNATREVLKAGAPQVIVPGNFPLGCFPYSLFDDASSDNSSYDAYGCLKSVNNLTIGQNQGLQLGLSNLREEFTNATILYADYYNAFLSLLQRAPVLGFDTETLFTNCCGVKGQYRILSPGFCGNLGAPVCPNPNVYIHWDGIHLTQNAHRLISEYLIDKFRDHSNL